MSLIDQLEKRTATIGIVGLGYFGLPLVFAYKPDVDDMRESPTFKLLDRFTEFGATVDYYDPHVPVIGPTREHSEREGKASVSWSEELIRTYDAVVISTNHRSVDLQSLSQKASLIFDCRNAMKDIAGSATIVKA